MHQPILNDFIIQYKYTLGKTVHKAMALWPSDNKGIAPCGSLVVGPWLITWFPHVQTESKLYVEYIKLMIMKSVLMVSTPLKNISQLEVLFPIYGKIYKMFQTTNQIKYVLISAHPTFIAYIPLPLLAWSSPIKIAFSLGSEFPSVRHPPCHSRSASPLPGRKGKVTSPLPRDRLLHERDYLLWRFHKGQSLTTWSLEATEYIEGSQSG